MSRHHLGVLHFRSFFKYNVLYQLITVFSIRNAKFQQLLVQLVIQLETSRRFFLNRNTERHLRSMLHLTVDKICGERASVCRSLGRYNESHSLVCACLLARVRHAPKLPRSSFAHWPELELYRKRPSYCSSLPKWTEGQQLGVPLLSQKSGRGRILQKYEFFKTYDIAGSEIDLEMSVKLAVHILSSNMLSLVKLNNTLLAEP